jgi:predicted ATPase
VSESDYQLDDIGDADRFIVLSGCSGGGKSTLLAALQRRGFAVFEEPGRQIVKE